MPHSDAHQQASRALGWRLVLAMVVTAGIGAPVVQVLWVYLLVGGLAGLGFGFWAVTRLGRSRRLSSRRTGQMMSLQRR